MCMLIPKEREPPDPDLDPAVYESRWLLAGQNGGMTSDAPAVVKYPSVPGRNQPYY
jgi:hypothetical protein